MRAFLQTLLGRDEGLPATPMPVFLRQAAETRWPDASATLHGGTLSLTFEDRDVSACTGDLERTAALHPERCSELVERWLTQIETARTRRVLAELELRDALPRILPEPVARGAAESNGPHGAATTACDGALPIRYVVNAGPERLTITRADVERWNITPADLRDAAHENLWHLTRGASILQEDVAGREVYQIRQGDGWDAARVCLPGLWRRLAESCEDALVLAVPSQDAVFAAPMHQPRSLERLVEHVQRAYATADAPVSPALFHYSDVGLTRWAGHS